ncbi:hypothetical protein PN462_12470 [Spirulina sp. CS-785/01]|uniref:hypothetical protein n=1 Tax=Spirulina sp. CS-785/01 TaxID=3021716 RepID=UPI00232FD7E8|nr:hypothetical protein [Spirulina sp. CS-785/01]MDB9313919.1 hypothetical protein [Spirulina sp. CS-785/01]
MLQFNLSTRFRLPFSLFLSLILPFLASASLAQTPHNSTNEGFQRNERDSLFEGENGLNPLDIMHRVNMGNKPSMGEFRQQTDRNLNEASEEFRRQQLQLLQQQLQQEQNATPSSEE